MSDNYGRRGVDSTEIYVTSTYLCHVLLKSSPGNYKSRRHNIELSFPSNSQALKWPTVSPRDYISCSWLELEYEDLSISSLFNVKDKIGKFDGSLHLRRLICSFRVLITGGGSGIGKMMASGFAQNGAHVYLAARKEKQLQEVCLPLRIHWSFLTLHLP